MTQPPRQPLVLSTTGSDRATAYTMSGKILRRDCLLLCTWLESRRRNRWAWVDPRGRRVVAGGWLGETVRDNHCGASLALGPDGTIHAVIGGHASLMGYCALLAGRRDEFTQSQPLPELGTYPSLVCDAGGTLHLTYRRCRRGTLEYCRRPAGGEWSSPRMLVRQVKEGYVNWTNALAIGPDGRLHLVFSNSRPQPDGGLYVGASYLCSTDGGESWRQPAEAKPVELPVSADALRLIEHPVPNPAKIVSPEQVAANEPGPQSFQLYQLDLSNPVADAEGRPWVVVHSVPGGEADLWRLDGDTWRAVPLTPAVRQRMPGHRIHAQSTLSRRADGSLEAVLMVAPEQSPGWGPAGTSPVRLTFDHAGAIRSIEPVCPARADVPTWLPSLERWSWCDPVDQPALLYTQGASAFWHPERHHSLINDIETSVFLDLP